MLSKYLLWFHSREVKDFITYLLRSWGQGKAYAVRKSLRSLFCCQLTKSSIFSCWKEQTPCFVAFTSLLFIHRVLHLNQSFKKLLYFFSLVWKISDTPKEIYFQALFLYPSSWIALGCYQRFELYFVFITEKKNHPLKVNIWSVELNSLSLVYSLALITVPGWPPARGRVPWQKSENSSISNSLFWIYGVFTWTALCWACSCWKGMRLGWEEEFSQSRRLQLTLMFTALQAASCCSLRWAAPSRPGKRHKRFETVVKEQSCIMLLKLCA